MTAAIQTCAHCGTERDFNGSTNGWRFFAGTNGWPRGRLCSWCTARGTMESDFRAEFFAPTIIAQKLEGTRL